eukprot:GEMP01016866.1.p1 GENE.GEMP01016866.1~~GEMP01016866.1.p1  ORF type:complete len:496 (+),score=88.73 GEMP01016866.1:260-1747(+)
MSNLKVLRVDTLEEMSAHIEDRGHDFWIGTYADCDHFDCRMRCQNSLTCEDLRAEDVFTHCYTLVCGDIKASSNVLFSRFGLGLRRKRVNSKAVNGCMYLLINRDCETDLHRRRARISNYDSSYRLSTEAKMRNSSLVFTVVDKAGFMQVLAKTKAFWLSSFSNMTTDAAPKQIMCTHIEGKPPEKLFSHCYLMPSANCRTDCDGLNRIYGFGVRQNRVRAKEMTGVVYCLVATKKPVEQAVEAVEHDRSRITSVIATASSPRKKEPELIPPINAYKQSVRDFQTQAIKTNASTIEKVPTVAQKQARKSAEGEVPQSSHVGSRSSSDVEEVDTKLPRADDSDRWRLKTDEPAVKRLRTEEPAKASTTTTAPLAEATGVSRGTPAPLAEVTGVSRGTPAPSAEATGFNHGVTRHNVKDKICAERRLKDQISMIRHVVRQLYPDLMNQVNSTGVPLTAEQVRLKVEDGLALPPNQNKLAAFTEDIFEYWEHLRGLFV